MFNKKILIIIAVCLIGTTSVYATISTFGFSFFESQIPEDWFVGTNLKQGDFFSYNLCHIDYKDCKEFQMDIWINGTIQHGSETKWLAKVVVYDGNVTKTGYMHLGMVSAEPIWSDDNIEIYVSAFKSSVTWLSAFAPHPIDSQPIDTSEKCIKFGWCD